MAEEKRLNYTNKELLILMLKDKGIHEGNWVLGAEFAFTASNIGQSPDGSDASPAGIVALSNVHIAQVQQPLPFSVDAAEANPKDS
jgi:hypothetical protein